MSEPKLAIQPSGEPASTMLRSCSTSKHADQAEHQAEPLQARDLLAHEAVGDGRGEDRLQARDQRRDAGRHALADGGEHAAEIKPVHQRTRHQAVADLRPVRPARLRRERDRAHDEHDEHHAHRQKRHRLDIGQPETRADEAGAPQQHEQHRRDGNGKFGQAHDGLGGGGLGDPVNSGRHCSLSTSGAVMAPCRRPKVSSALHTSLFSEPPPQSMGFPRTRRPSASGTEGGLP